MLHGLWQHCSTMPRLTNISIWSLKANSATSFPAPVAPPIFGERSPDGTVRFHAYRVWLCLDSPDKAVIKKHEETPQPEHRAPSAHREEGPRLSWGCRRILCLHRPGTELPPGESHTGAAGRWLGSPDTTR